MFCAPMESLTFGSPTAPCPPAPRPVRVCRRAARKHQRKGEGVTKSPCTSASRDFLWQRKGGADHGMVEAAGSMASWPSSCHPTCTVTVTQIPRALSPSDSGCPGMQEHLHPILRLKKSESVLSFPLSPSLKNNNNSGSSLRKERGR